MGSIFRKISIFSVIAIFSAIPPVSAQETGSRPHLLEGLVVFSEGRYAESLPLFRRAESTETDRTRKAEAQYWSILARIALGETSSVLPDIETFRTRNHDCRFLPDLLYQRGRIQYGAGDLMAAYESFAWFVNEPLWTHPLRPSAIFWMGECLLAMGKPELARKTFEAIVKDYSRSVKSGAARSRLESMDRTPITMKGTAREMTDLDRKAELLDAKAEILNLLEEYVRTMYDGTVKK